jgi:glycosyltransferase involved in cell wall biosynthesis
MSELRGLLNAQVGVVIIGRNEGERLRRCLHSVLAESPALVVYVDSGSTDSSVELSRSLGVEVVELDMLVPFSAARARSCLGSICRW